MPPRKQSQNGRSENQMLLKACQTCCHTARMFRKPILRVSLGISHLGNYRFCINWKPSNTAANESDAQIILARQCFGVSDLRKLVPRNVMTDKEARWCFFAAPRISFFLDGYLPASTTEVAHRPVYQTLGKKTAHSTKNWPSWCSSFFVSASSTHFLLGPFALSYHSWKFNSAILSNALQIFFGGKLPFQSNWIVDLERLQPFEPS